MKTIPAFRLALVASALLLSHAPPARACSRVLFTAPDGTVLTARSADWPEDMRTNLWALPRGMKRDGATGPGAPSWTARYGSVVATAYDMGSLDGMNEKGLVANALYLTAADFGKPDGRPAVSVSLWLQYTLDNFATVDEAVAFYRRETFRVAAASLPNGVPAQVHLSLSDASGDSAILEYVKGKLVVHHGKEFVVMTNDPAFEEQLALNAYWKSIGGFTFLPGTARAADRFVRASFLVGSIPRKVDEKFIAAVPGHSFEFQAIASMLGVIRAVSLPIGMGATGAEGLYVSSTIWRVVSDSKNRVYVFDSATSPNTFWVPMADLDLGEGAPVRKLEVEGGKVYAGNAAARFVEAAPFVFTPAPAGVP